MTAWHYEKAGQRHGAVSAQDIAALIERREIDGRTLVWSAGFMDWTPLVDTELAIYLKTTNVPPSLPGARISNTVVWCLAVAPIIGMMLEAMLAGALAPSEAMAEYAGAVAMKTGQYWYVTLALNIGLSLLDERKLKGAGVDTSRFGKLVFVVPVYLWQRAAALKQRPTYFWVWLGTFCLTLLASA